MANKKIYELPARSSLDGSEFMPLAIVSAAAQNATLAQIMAFINKNPIVDLVDGSSVPWNSSTANVARWTIAGANALAVSGTTSGEVSTGAIILKQGGSGGNIPTLPGVLETGASFSNHVGDVDILSFFFDGTDFYWNVLNYGTVSPTLTKPTLTITPSTSTIALSSSTVSGATAYKFERADNAGFTTGVTTLQNTSSTTFTDTTAVSGTTYYYRVTATATGYVPGISSIGSGALSGGTTLTPPTLTVTPNGPIVLSCNSVTSATGYKFERATDSGFTAGLTTLQDTAATSFIDYSAVVGTPYYYRVTAHASGYTDGVSATQSATRTSPDRMYTSFTAANGTLVTALTPDIGPGSWTERNSPGVSEVQSNQGQIKASVGTPCVSLYQSGLGDIKITANLTIQPGMGSSSPLMFFFKYTKNASLAVDTSYAVALYNTYATVLEFSSGAGHGEGTAHPFTFNDGVEKLIEIYVTGDVIRVDINGTTLFTQTALVTGRTGPWVGYQISDLNPANCKINDFRVS